MNSFSRVPLLAESYISMVDRLALVTVLIIALALRFYGLERPFFWADEAFSLRLGSLPIDQIWYFSGRDVHPPFYYFVLHIWSLIWGESQYAARALSAVCGSMAVVCSACLVRTVAGARGGLVCGILSAFLPIAIRYSQEARMYALLSLLVVASTLALAAWVKKPERKRYLCCYVFFAVLSIYTHYFSVLAILSNWMFLCWLSGGRTSKHNYMMYPAWWVANVCILIFYIPWSLQLLHLVHAFDLIGSHGAFSWIPKITFQTIPSLFWSFITLHDVRAVEVPVSWTLTVLILSLSWFIVVRDKKPFALGTLVVACGWIPVVVSLVISVVVPVLTARYLAFCAMFLPMIVAVAITYSNLRHAIVVVVAVVVVLIQLPGVISVYQQSDDLNFSRNSKDFPMERVAEKLKSSTVSGDRVVVGGLLWYYPLWAYGITDRTTMLYEQDWVNDTASRPTGYGLLSLLDPVRDDVFLYSLAKLSSEVKRVWWMTGRASETYNESSAVFPENWVQEGEWKFGKLRLRLFNIKAPPDERRQPSTDTDAFRYFTQPPHPAAQNCPLAPSATSANRTRRSLPR
ncbi:glycosyltransferase family 39 protein [Pseudomonas sp. KCJK9016]|uniref:glycosyltransferase family 39 protein n=1 Tax=Pseudomonas sp. KCJK9016 TaxID=3344556 RepID=UPI003906469D